MRRRYSRDLTSEAIRETVRFLREPANRDQFTRRLHEWDVAADALEEADLIHHAQQIRSLISLARVAPRSPSFDEYGPLNELRLGAASALGPGGVAPRSIWGYVMTYNGEMFLDSIYVRPFPGIQVFEAIKPRRLRSGATLLNFRAQYAGHKYSGSSSHVFQGRGWLQLYRGASLKSLISR